MATWNPEDYARHSSAQLQWARELESRLGLHGTEALLDLGCGDGKITAQLARAVPQGRALGIDSSEEMIRYAREQHPTSAYPSLAFRCLDVRRLDYRDEFDVVFSNAALHWVGDHRAVLAGVHRALRSGGRLLFSFGGKGNAAAVLEIVDVLGCSPEWRHFFQGFQNPYSFYAAEDYRPWLADAGFVARRVDLVPKDMVHRGPEGLAAWIRTTWMPITARVPESKREDFIADLAAAYVTRFPADAAGDVHVPMVRLEVDASKT